MYITQVGSLLFPLWFWWTRDYYLPVIVGLGILEIPYKVDTRASAYSAAAGGL